MINGSQAIFAGTIAPDAGALLIDFKTVRPAKPVFTVWRNILNEQDKDMVPENQVAFSLETPTPTTNHSKRIAGLPQGMKLWLRIDAQAEDLPVGDPRGAASSVVGTGTFVRVCLVKIGSLEVLNNGDSGGGADMLFQFQVFDGSDSVGEGLIDLFQLDVDSIDNGEFVPGIVHTFKIDNAPDVVVPYLSSLHRKGGFPTIGTRTIPDTLPDEAGSGSNDDFEFADVMGRVSLPTQLGDTTQSGFMMNTGLNVPSITATLAFETNVLNPSNILPVKLFHHGPGFP